MGLIGTKPFAKVREDRTVVIVVGGDHITSLRTHAKSLFAHDPQRLLMVDKKAFAAELGRHPPIAVTRILDADLADLLDDLCVLRPLPHWWAIDDRARFRGHILA